WLRFRARDATASFPALVHTVLAAAHELYWDGVLIGHSGVPANDADTEQPGKLRSYYPLPESLRTPGEHVIAVRLSNRRASSFGANPVFAVLVTSPAEFEVFRWRILAGPVMQVGSMLIFALAALIMWCVAA